jgi:hypothetical protein
MVIVGSVPARWSWSGDFPGPIAEGGNEVEVAAECCDVVAYDVDAGYLTVLDLGDPGLADAQGVGEFSLGDASGLADLGELESTDVSLSPFARGGFPGGAFGFAGGSSAAALALTSDQLLYPVLIGPPVRR